MKKRALSMLLALALCFTVFSGVGSAAIKVDNVVGRAGNLLKNARTDQQDVIESLSNAGIVKAFFDENADPLADKAMASLVEKLIKDEDFKEAKTIFPYFLLRYIEAGQDKRVTPEAYPIIADPVTGILKQLADADDEINTSDGEGVNASLNKFTPYEEKLEQIVQNSGEAAADEFKELGYYDYDVDAEGLETELKNNEALVDELIAKTADSEGLKARKDELVAERDRLTAEKDRLEAEKTRLEDLKAELEALKEAGSLGDYGSPEELQAAIDKAQADADKAQADAEQAQKDADEAQAKAEVLQNDIIEAVKSWLYTADPSDIPEEVSQYINEEKTGFITEGEQADKVIAWAKGQVVRDLKWFIPVLYATGRNEFASVDEVYDTLMAPADPDTRWLTDVAKKNLALVVGQDLIKELTTNMVPAMKNYVSAANDMFVDRFLNGLNTYAAVFDDNDQTAVEAAQNLAHDVAAFVLNNEAGLPADNEAVVKIEKIKTLLKETKGIDDPLALYDDFMAVVTEADGATLEAFDYRSVMLNLALKGAVDIYDFDDMIDDPNLASAEPVRALANGAAVVPALYNRVLKRPALNVARKFPAGDLTLVSRTAGVKLVKTTEAWEVEYNPFAKDLPATAKIDIYRGVINREQQPDGAYAVTDDPAKIDAATTRYIETITVNLVPQTLGANEIYITNVNNERSLSHRDTLKVEGVTSLPAASIGVEYADAYEGDTTMHFGSLAIQSDGTFVAEINLGVIEGETGVAGEKPFGNYNIFVGVSDKEWSRSDTASFYLAPWITASVENNEKTVSKRNVAKGDAKALKDVKDAFGKSKPLTVTLSIEGANENIVYKYSDAENRDAWFYDFEDVVNAEYEPNSTKSQTVDIHYLVPDYNGHDYADVIGDVGLATLTINRPSSNGGGGGGGGGATKELTLNRGNLKNQYYPGEGILIQGTSKGYDTIRVRVTGPDGTSEVIELTPDQFKDGYYLRLTEPGIYTIDIEGQKFTVTVVTLDENIFEKDNHFNYIIGYEDNTVRPEANISREEVAAILYRLLKTDIRAGFQQDTTNAYSDIESDRWSMANIATLNNIGIIRGYEDNTFRPGRAISRAEFAALISRLVQVDDVKAAPEIIKSFTDVDTHWAKDDIYIVAAKGWFLGDAEGGTFRPDDKITRAEAITVINRILDRDKVTAASFGENKVTEFTDLAADAWYYAQVIEATNAHTYTKDETTGDETWNASEDATDWAE